MMMDTLERRITHQKSQGQRSKGFSVETKGTTSELTTRFRGTLVQVPWMRGPEVCNLLLFHFPIWVSAAHHLPSSWKGSQVEFEQNAINVVLLGCWLDDNPQALLNAQGFVC